MNRLPFVVLASLLSTSCSLVNDFSISDGGGSDAGASDAETVIDAGCVATCDDVCTDTQNDPLHCGNCVTSCSAPENGGATCMEGGCGFECDPGYYAVLGTCEPRLAPRPIAPLSTSTATSRRPTFGWELGARSDGARIQICADRVCTSVLQTIDASGTSGRPPTDLPTGVVFWRLFGRQGIEVGVEPSPTWQVNIGALSAPVDTSWGTTLDLNGDGYADLVVGAPYQDNPETDEGSVYLYFGAADFEADPASSEPDVVLDNPLDQPNGNFGHSVASAGDLNGDGYGDLVVGADRQDNPEMDEGTAYVYFGHADFDPDPSSSGSDVGPDIVLDNPLDQAIGQCGTSVASAGDLNGDGYADLIVGAYAQNNPEMYEGSVYVYFGAPDFDDSPDVVLDNPLDQPGANFGSSLATAGDLNGDGYADLVVGASNQDNPATDQGATYVYLGATDFDTDPSSTSPDVVLDDPLDQAGGRFGARVASAGDLNGDGYADLIVSASEQDNPEFNEGNAHVYFGAADFDPDPSLSGSDVDADVVLDNPLDQPSGTFGSVASAGDLNGDGYADLIVGAYFQDNPESNEGAAYVYLGAVDFRTDPTASSPDVVLDSPLNQVNGAFGYSVACAGDLNGDGYADLVVGAFGQDSPESNEGSAYVYSGTVDFDPDPDSSGPDISPDVVLDNPRDEAGAQFGFSVASADAFERGSSRRSGPVPWSSPFTARPRAVVERDRRILLASA